VTVRIGHRADAVAKRVGAARGGAVDAVHRAIRGLVAVLAPHVELAGGGVELDALVALDLGRVAGRAARAGGAARAGAPGLARDQLIALEQEAVGGGVGRCAAPRSDAFDEAEPGQTPAAAGETVAAARDVGERARR